MYLDYAVLVLFVWYPCYIQQSTFNEHGRNAVCSSAVWLLTEPARGRVGQIF